MTPYKILQVDPEAEQDVIEAAYKRLASKYHPDKDPSSSATSRMQEINAAYDILKDSERRRRYDHQQRAKETQPEREQPEPAHEQARRDDPPPARSSSVFSTVLWLSALIALIVYFPWGVAILLGIWATVLVARRYPGASGKLLKRGLVLAVTVGVGLAVYVWMLDREDTRKREAEQAQVQQLDVNTVLQEQLKQFTATCTASATKVGPTVAQRYCACMAGKLQTDFDATPIVAESVYWFNTAFDARFKAALPDDAAQAACRREATPVPQFDFGASSPTSAKPRRTSKPRPSDDPALQGVVPDFTAPQ
jgi:DnaJ domain